jgi:hypothetical protein
MRLVHLVDQIGEGSVDLISAILVQRLRIYSSPDISLGSRRAAQKRTSVAMQAIDRS